MQNLLNNIKVDVVLKVDRPMVGDVFTVNDLVIFEGIPCAIIYIESKGSFNLPLAYLRCTPSIGSRFKIVGEHVYFIDKGDRKIRLRRPLVQAL